MSFYFTENFLENRKRRGQAFSMLGLLSDQEKEEALLLGKIGGVPDSTA